MEMDYTSPRLAEELFLPHKLVVKKIRKYAGFNQKQSGGRIYTDNNRLAVIKYGLIEKGEPIYGFNREQYDKMSAQEVSYNEKMRKQAKKVGKKNYEGGALQKHQKGKK